jgi:hypothetical protein
LTECGVGIKEDIADDGAVNQTNKTNPHAKTQPETRTDDEPNNPIKRIEGTQTPRTYSQPDRIVHLQVGFTKTRATTRW